MSDPTGRAEPSKPTLVYLYGPPAVGKLTVAERVAALTGYRLFHNHLTVNAVRQVFEFGSPPFMAVVHRLRIDVFRTAAATGLSLIFTNNSAWSGEDPRDRFEAFADQARRTVEEEGGRTLFVRMTAPLAEMERRLGADSRQRHQKLNDVARLRELVSTLDQSPLHADDLSVDTAALSPDQAAAAIVRALRIG